MAKEQFQSNSATTQSFCSLISSFHSLKWQRWMRKTRLRSQRLHLETSKRKRRSWADVWHLAGCRGHRDRRGQQGQPGRNWTQPETQKNYLHIALRMSTFTFQRVAAVNSPSIRSEDENRWLNSIWVEFHSICGNWSNMESLKNPKNPQKSPKIPWNCQVYLQLSLKILKIPQKSLEIVKQMCNNPFKSLQILSNRQES